MLKTLISTEETGLDRSEVGTVNMFPLKRIKPSAEQARKQFNKDQLAELAQSIREHGVLQPMVIRSDGMLIAGERRLRACKLAGLIEAPVIVRDVEDSKESYLLGLIENLQRVDLNAMEEAQAYGVLRDQHHLTQEQIAAQVGKSRPAVANALRLLKLPGSVQDLIQDGQLTAGHANELLALGDKVSDIVRLANDCVSSDWTVLELRQNVDFVLSRTRQPAPATQPATTSGSASSPTNQAHPDEHLDPAFGAASKQQPDNSEMKAQATKPAPASNTARTTQSGGFSANGADPYESIDPDGEFDYSDEDEDPAEIEEATPEPEQEYSQPEPGDTTALSFFDGQVLIQIGRLDVDLSNVLSKYTGYRVSITVDLFTEKGATSFEQIEVGSGSVR